MFHNPACSTFRNALALIRSRGAEPVVIEYLKRPPDRAKLVELVAAMGATVRDVLSQKGTPYDELKLDDPKWHDDQLIDFMVWHPILMNRPTIVTPLGTRRRRPSEAALSGSTTPLASTRPENDSARAIHLNGRVVADRGPATPSTRLSRAGVRGPGGLHERQLEAPSVLGLAGWKGHRQVGLQRPAARWIRLRRLPRHPSNMGPSGGHRRSRVRNASLQIEHL